jgi:hypothetical protein
MSHLTNCDRCGEHTWVDDIEEAPGVFCEDCQKWYAEHPGPAAMSRLEPLTADTAIRLLERAVAEVDSLRQQLEGAVAENERLRHEVQARDDVIYHAAKHLRHALDVIAAYEDGITVIGGSSTMSLIERAEAIIHDWTCGCGKGQACPNRDGCREAAEQIAADLATTRGAEEERDRLREVLRAVLMEPDPIKRNQLAAPVLASGAVAR